MSGLLSLQSQIGYGGLKLWGVELEESVEGADFYLASAQFLLRSQDCLELRMPLVLAAVSHD